MFQWVRLYYATMSCGGGGLEMHRHCFLYQGTGTVYWLYTRLYFWRMWKFMGFCEMLGGSVLFVESLIALWKVGSQGELFLPIKPFLQNGMQCTFTKIAKLQQS